MDRFSGLVLGTYDDIEIVGFRAQFTNGYLGENTSHFVNVTKGDGMNKDSKCEGFVKNNFFQDLYFRSDSCFESVLHKENTLQAMRRRKKKVLPLNRKL